MQANESYLATAFLPIPRDVVKNKQDPAPQISRYEHIKSFQ